MSGHTPSDLPGRIAARILVDANGCWLWQGSLATGPGYGRVTTPQGKVLAHRFVYERLVGPIPPGLTIDHLCRVRHCVNPAHLEPVTQHVNVHRSPIAVAAINAGKTECKWGHPFSPENTYVQPDGRRQCKTCMRRAKERHAAKAS